MTTIAPTTTAHAVSAGEAERIWITGDTIHLLATGESTGGALTLLEVEAAPGGGPPPHTHDAEDEAWYVLDGTFEILMGDRTVRATRGDFAFVPRGMVHRFENVGDRMGRVLVLFTPGGIEGFFRGAGQPATSDGPAPALDQAEIERTGPVAERYGLRVVAWK